MKGCVVGRARQRLELRRSVGARAPRGQWTFGRCAALRAQSVPATFGRRRRRAAARPASRRVE